MMLEQKKVSKEEKVIVSFLSILHCLFLSSFLAIFQTGTEDFFFKKPDMVVQK